MAQLVEHCIRDAGVAGSNPVVPTIKFQGNQSVTVERCTLIFRLTEPFGTFLAPFFIEPPSGSSTRSNSVIHGVEAHIVHCLRRSSSETRMYLSATDLSVECPTMRYEPLGPSQISVRLSSTYDVGPASGAQVLQPI